MDTQKNLVNTLFSNQEKSSSQNLKHCCCQQNEQKNNHHHRVNKVSKHTFVPAIIKRINIITRKSGQINHNFQTKITKKVTNHNCKYQTQPQQTSLYIENLDQEVNEDVYEAFGLKSTKYLSQNSYIDFVIDKQTGKSKGYAFVTVPAHISEELMNLNGLEFIGKNLLIEEARKKLLE